MYASLNKDDYYSHMYDIEQLTFLNKTKTKLSKSDSLKKIEQLVRDNKCDTVSAEINKLSISEEEEKYYLMIEGALEIKDLIFKDLVKEHSSWSPKKWALEELSLYLKKDLQSLSKQMLVEEPVAQAWKELKPDPTNEDEVNNFYRVTDSYIYELMAANHIIQTLYSFYVLTKKLEKLNVKKILDYGAGAGTLSILFKQLGYNVIYADLSGKTFEFAKWRIKNRNLDIPMIDLDLQDINDIEFDCILCTEVFEHLVDPISMIDKFRNRLKKNELLIVSESCEYVKDFVSHLESNRKYGGDNFINLLKEKGFENVSKEPYIPQLIFSKQ